MRVTLTKIAALLVVCAYAAVCVIGVLKSGAPPRTLAIVAVVIAVVIVVMLLQVRAAMGRRPARKSLEDMLAILEQCGLKLAEPFEVKDLLESWDRSEFEKGGYDLALVGLGTTEEREPCRNHCVNLWHFDTECIYDHGDYKRIAERMAEMSQGSLPLENVRDHVDVEKGEAWLSFRLKGREVRIDCKVEDDWVDTSVLGRFVDLLGESDPAKLFVYYDLGGQDCIVGCVSREDFRRLKAHGIKFKPLK